MRRTVVLVVALVVLVPVSATALPASAALGQSAAEAAETGNGNGTDDANTTDTAPGARLAGVVGSQSARIDGEVARRSFAVRMRRANTTGARAAVVAETVTETNESLAALEARLDELRAARAAGNISESAYRAKVAVVAGRIEAASALANRSATAANDLPAAALRERGVPPVAARNLAERASELGGPQVAAIARNVTGRSPDAHGPPEDVPAGGIAADSPDETVSPSAGGPTEPEERPENASAALSGERGSSTEAANEATGGNGTTGQTGPSDVDGAGDATTAGKPTDGGNASAGSRSAGSSDGNASADGGSAAGDPAGPNVPTR